MGLEMKRGIGVVAVPMPGPGGSSERVLVGLRRVLLIGSVSGDGEQKREFVVLRKGQEEEGWVRCESGRERGL